MRGYRVGTGGPDHPPEKSQTRIKFLCNTGPDPLKNHKATKPNSMLGRHRYAMVGRGWPAFSGIWILL